MGIRNLWRLLDYFAEPTNGEQWRGRTIAVDASVWLSQMVATSSRRRSNHKSAEEKLLAAEGVGGGGGGNGWGQLSGDEMSVVLEGFLERIIKLLWLDITPVFVFDGKAPEAKVKEQARRRMQRAQVEELKLVSAARIVVDAQVATMSHEELTGSSSGGELTNNSGSSKDLHAQVQRLSRERQKAITKQHSVEIRAPSPGTIAADIKRLKAIAREAASRSNQRREATAAATNRELGSVQTGTSSSANVSRFLCEEGHRAEAMHRSRTLISTNRLQASVSSSSSLFLGTPDALAAQSTASLLNQEAENDDDVIFQGRGAVPLVQPRQLAPSSRAVPLRRVTAQPQPIPVVAAAHQIQHNHDEPFDVDDSDEWSSVENGAPAVAEVLSLTSDENSQDNEDDIPPWDGSSSMSTTTHLNIDDGVVQPTTSYDECETISSDDNDDITVSSTTTHHHTFPNNNTANVGQQQSILVFMEGVKEAVRRQDVRHNTNTLPHHQQKKMYNTLAGGLPFVTLEHSSSNLYRKLSADDDDGGDGDLLSSAADDLVDGTLQDVLVMLRLCGAPYVVSPGEADAQCAYLCDVGLVDAVFTEDSDVVAHGASVVLRGFFTSDSNGATKSSSSRSTHGVTHTPPPPVRAYRRSKLTAAGLPPFHLKVLAILLGCDYTNGIPGIGVARALRVLAAYSLIHHHHLSPTPQQQHAATKPATLVDSEAAYQSLAPLSTAAIYQKQGMGKGVVVEDEEEDEGPHWSILQSLISQPSAIEELIRLLTINSTPQGGERATAAEQIKGALLQLQPDVFAALFHPPVAKINEDGDTGGRADGRGDSSSGSSSMRFRRGIVNWGGLRHFATIRDVSPLTLNRLVQLQQALLARDSAAQQHIHSGAVALFATSTSSSNNNNPVAQQPPPPVAASLPDDCHVKQELTTLSLLCSSR